MLREYGYDLDTMEESHGLHIDEMASIHLDVPYYKISMGTEYTGKGFSMIRVNYTKEITSRGREYYGLIVEVESDVLAVQMRLKYA
jgi:hypothetical protein